MRSLRQATAWACILVMLALLVMPAGGVLTAAILPEPFWFVVELSLSLERRPLEPVESAATAILPFSLISRPPPRAPSLHPQDFQTLQETCVMERKLRQLLAIGFLALGMLTGASVDPQKIEELFQQMSRPKIVQVHQPATTRAYSKARRMATKSSVIAAGLRSHIIAQQAVDVL